MNEHGAGPEARLIQARKASWEPPTVVLLGNIRDLVRSQTKPASPHLDSDLTGRKPPGQ